MTVSGADNAFGRKDTAARPHKALRIAVAGDVDVYHMDHRRELLN